MKRRGFLGFLGGAAAVGPAAVKNAVAQLPSGLGTSAAYSGLSNISPVGVPVSAFDTGRDWRLDEADSLRRLLTGDLTDEEREHRRREKLQDMEAVISNRYAGLQSVAACRKIELFNRDMRALRAEVSRSYARGRLAELLKQIGGEA